MPTALITGANRGLGLEFIRQYANAGWTVIGSCRDLDSAVEARALADAHPNLTLYPLDVTDAAAVQSLASTLEGTAIDVLILNAGVMGKQSLVLGELDPADFLQVLNVNVVAPAICLQAFRAHVAASEQRKVVGIGSFLGSIGSDDMGGLHSYRASKAGIHAVMHAASIDLREAGVTVIPMHPGWVQTDMGGADATITTAESIAGMIKVIDGLTPADSGRLLTYSGEELPW
jgi:NAD(P)-dependent dehydrogenase (short-subunit alcohol dehydrogenase family)